MRRAGRMLWAFVISLVLAGPTWIAFRSFRAEYLCFHPPPRSFPKGRDALGLPRIRDVRFVSSDGTQLRGWYHPSDNGAAVLLAHGSLGDRTALLEEGRLLAKAGFGVLWFDFPGHGASAGRVEWGGAERRALNAALGFVSRQRGVDPSRVGVLGLSMGGTIAIQWAAVQRRVSAVAVAATPPDVEGFTRYEYSRWGALAQRPALWALEVSGMKLRELEARRVVRRIAPRPLLVIAGDADAHLPMWMARQLYTAADAPKHWFVVRGAGHGGFASVPDSGYARRLTDFFTASLVSARHAPGTGVGPRIRP